MGAAPATQRPLAVLESIRCLECGEVYARPGGGSAVRESPGCPVCGYVGWIPVTLPQEPSRPHRSGAGRRTPRLAPTR